MRMKKTNSTRWWFVYKHCACMNFMKTNRLWMVNAHEDVLHKRKPWNLLRFVQIWWTFSSFDCPNFAIIELNNKWFNFQIAETSEKKTLRYKMIIHEIHYSIVLDEHLPFYYVNTSLKMVFPRFNKLYSKNVSVKSKNPKSRTSWIKVKYLV